MTQVPGGTGFADTTFQNRSSDLGTDASVAREFVARRSSLVARGFRGGEVLTRLFGGDRARLEQIFGKDYLPSLESLAKEKSQKSFYRGLLDIARDLEDEDRLSLALNLYEEVRSHAPSKKLQDHAKIRLGGMGITSDERRATSDGERATILARAEHLIKRIPSTGLDWVLVGSMWGAGLTFKSTRLIGMNLFGKSSLLRRTLGGWGIKGMASGMGLLAEAPVFAALGMGGNLLAGREVDTSWEGFLHATESGFYILGPLKASGYAGKRLFDWAHRVHPVTQEISHLTKFAKVTRGVNTQSWMLGGILAGNELEVMRGLRDRYDGATTLVNGLGTLAHFGLAGLAMKPVFAPFRPMEQRLEMELYKLSKSYDPAYLKAAKRHALNAYAKAKQWWDGPEDRNGFGPPLALATGGYGLYRAAPRTEWFGDPLKGPVLSKSSGNEFDGPLTEAIDSASRGSLRLKGLFLEPGEIFKMIQEEMGTIERGMDHLPDTFRKLRRSVYERELQTIRRRVVHWEGELEKLEDHLGTERELFSQDISIGMQILLTRMSRFKGILSGEGRASRPRSGILPEVRSRKRFSIDPSRKLPEDLPWAPFARKLGDILKGDYKGNISAMAVDLGETKEFVMALLSGSEWIGQKWFLKLYGTLLYQDRNAFTDAHPDMRKRRLVPVTDADEAFLERYFSEFLEGEGLSEAPTKFPFPPREGERIPLLNPKALQYFSTKNFNDSVWRQVAAGLAYYFKLKATDVSSPDRQAKGEKFHARMIRWIFNREGWSRHPKNPREELLFLARERVALYFGGALPKSHGLPKVPNQNNGSSTLSRWLHGAPIRLESLRDYDNFYGQVRNLLRALEVPEAEVEAKIAAARIERRGWFFKGKVPRSRPLPEPLESTSLPKPDSNNTEKDFIPTLERALQIIPQWEGIAGELHHFKVRGDLGWGETDVGITEYQLLKFRSGEFSPYILRQISAGVAGYFYLKSRDSQTDSVQRSEAKENYQAFIQWIFLREVWETSFSTPEEELLYLAHRGSALRFGGLLPAKPAIPGTPTTQHKGSTLTRWLKGKQITLESPMTAEEYYRQIQDLLLGFGISESYVEKLINKAALARQGWAEENDTAGQRLLWRARLLVIQRWRKMLPSKPEIEGVPNQNDDSTLTRWLRDEEIQFSSKNSNDQVRSLLVGLGMPREEADLYILPAILESLDWQDEPKTAGEKLRSLARKQVALKLGGKLGHDHGIPGLGGQNHRNTLYRWLERKEIRYSSSLTAQDFYDQVRKLLKGLEVPSSDVELLVSKAIFEERDWPFNPALGTAWDRLLWVARREVARQKGGLLGTNHGIQGVPLQRPYTPLTGWLNAESVRPTPLLFQQITTLLTGLGIEPKEAKSLVEAAEKVGPSPSSMGKRTLRVPRRRRKKRQAEMRVQRPESYGDHSISKLYKLAEEENLDALVELQHRFPQIHAVRAVAMLGTDEEVPQKISRVARAVIQKISLDPLTPKEKAKYNFLIALSDIQPGGRPLDPRTRKMLIVELAEAGHSKAEGLLSKEEDTLIGSSVLSRSSRGLRGPSGGRVENRNDVEGTPEQGRLEENSSGRPPPPEDPVLALSDFEGIFSSAKRFEEFLQEHWGIRQERVQSPQPFPQGPFILYFHQKITKKPKPLKISFLAPGEFIDKVNARLLKANTPIFRVVPRKSGKKTKWVIVQAKGSYALELALKWLEGTHGEIKDPVQRRLLVRALGYRNGPLKDDLTMEDIEVFLKRIRDGKEDYLGKTWDLLQKVKDQPQKRPREIYLVFGGRELTQGLNLLTARQVVKDSTERTQIRFELVEGRYRYRELKNPRGSRSGHHFGYDTKPKTANPDPKVPPRPQVEEIEEPETPKTKAKPSKPSGGKKISSRIRERDLHVTMVYLRNVASGQISSNPPMTSRAMQTLRETNLGAFFHGEDYVGEVVKVLWHLADKGPRGINSAALRFLTEMEKGEGPGEGKPLQKPPQVGKGKITTEQIEENIRFLRSVRRKDLTQYRSFINSALQNLMETQLGFQGRNIVISHRALKVLWETFRFAPANLSEKASAVMAFTGLNHPRSEIRIRTGQLLTELGVSYAEKISPSLLSALILGILKSPYAYSKKQAITLLARYIPEREDMITPEMALGLIQNGLGNDHTGVAARAVEVLKWLHYQRPDLFTPEVEKTLTDLVAGMPDSKLKAGAKELLKG